jgi:hypothetical protein
MEEQTKSMKTVFTVIDRGGKSFWVRVGVGFTNRDGSLNLKLDAIPVNGTLQVRDWQPYEKGADGGEAPLRARAPRARDASGFGGTGAGSPPPDSPGLL